MVKSAGNWLLTAHLCLLLAMQLGCANGPLSDLAALSPFARESDGGGRYGPTPGQQVAEIQRLGREARDAEPVAQQQITAELAQRLISETDPLLRERIVVALGPLPAPAATEALRQAVQDRNTSVRLRAVQAWEDRPAAEAVPVLAEVLASDTNTDVRLAATRALGQFRDPAAVRPLSVALEDSDPALQFRAVQSLKKITNRDLGADLAAWRRFARGEVVESSQDASVVSRLTGGRL
jgi:HEAT repeat protein